MSENSTPSQPTQPEAPKEARRTAPSEPKVDGSVSSENEPTPTRRKAKRSRVEVGDKVDLLERTFGYKHSNLVGRQDV